MELAGTDWLSRRMRGTISSAAVIVIGLMMFGAESAVAADDGDYLSKREGTFTQTDSMSQPRFDAEAVALSDGRVLVIGGKSDLSDYYSPFTPTAEIYDPSTGKWSTTGSLNKSRESPQVLLLKGGKVLVVGGWNGDPSSGIYNDPTWSTVEVWDPATGQFTLSGLTTGNYNVGHAVALANGKALLIGDTYEAYPKPIAEVFDPASGTFTVQGNPVKQRDGGNLTLLPSGKVLVTGGRSGSITVNCSLESYMLESEIFDPSTGNFSLAGNLVNRRIYSSSFVRADGKAVILGGSERNGLSCNDLAPLTKAEIYDPNTGQFSPGGSAYVSSSFPWAALDDDRVFSVTGEDWMRDTPRSPYYLGLIDPLSSDGDAIVTGPMAAPHQSGIAVKIPGGKVLVAGGTSEKQDVANGVAEIFDPATKPPVLKFDFTEVGTFKASPVKKSIRRGKTGTIALTFTNVGDQFLGRNKVCGTVPAKDSRHLRLAGKCGKDDAVGPGKTGKVKFKVVVKKKAKKGKTIPIKFVLATEDFDEGTPITKSTTAKVKIK